ncbi:unnamed protein product [Prunus armeniaca]|uniref:Uncharacterized protein n=1 Tax=Prunus armeniaca TaxID=36596 RepID=A0A6J5TPF5_PRUAR|nr:unnamed protein product [Prunus armeniaca]
MGKCRPAIVAKPSRNDGVSSNRALDGKGGWGRGPSVIGDTQETCWIRREGDVVDVQELFGYIGLINLYDFQMERTHNSTCFWVLSYFPGVSSLTAMLSDAGWPQNAMGLNLLLSFQTRNPLGKLCC